MVGLSSNAVGREVAATDAAITELHAGNVVLYGDGWSSGAMVQATTQRLQGLVAGADGGIEPFIAGNQEGGQFGAFQAFYGPDFDAMPAAIRQGQGDPALLQESARLWGEQLAAVGVNLNLAPVLDTVPYATRAQNDPIGYWGREYGFIPEDVTTYGVAFARGMRLGGEAVALKHFPGLGRVTGNTDFTAEGTIDNDFTGLDDPYLQPFKAGIDAGAEFVMVSSAVYPRVDIRRAIFSPSIVTGILRQGLAFQGIVITDDVGAAAAVAGLTPGQRALRFLLAGGDMILTVQPNDIAPMVQAITAASQTDATVAARVEESVRRVLSVKAAQGLLPAPADAGC